MAYRIQKGKEIREELELADENGVVKHRITVVLDADAIQHKLNEKYYKLSQVYKELGELKDKLDRREEGPADQAMEAYAGALNELLNVIFGKEAADTILKFYDYKYIAMSMEVMPFISNVILPELNESVMETKKRLVENYQKKRRNPFRKK